MGYWTNPSVLKLAGDADPIESIQEKARLLVLGALERGWEGPPFEPFELAEYLGIQVAARDDIQDARMVAAGGQRLKIEYNPHRSRARIRFSVAHEIGHALFPDCAEAFRTRARVEQGQDSWQMEMLCNLAAAELLMPIGTGMRLEREAVTIDNILRLQKEYDVSTEAIGIRLIKLTADNCTLFAAARTSPAYGSAFAYRADYSVASRAANFRVPLGFRISTDTVMSQCTAVGYTAKGSERWNEKLPRMYLECVGIPPYPGERFPRIVSIARPEQPTAARIRRINYLWGDALQPRATGRRIIAHIVNDKTPNWGGAGFAREVKMRLASVQDDFRRWASSDPADLALGRIHATRVSKELQVVSMVAQRGYGPSARPRIRYGALKDCLTQLARLALAEQASVHMPRIGSGHAGGKWPVIAEFIDEVLVQRGVDVSVYGLPTSQPADETQGILSFGSVCQ